MYSYHRNYIATIWHMQERKKKKNLMQQFSRSLNVPERIRKGYVWSVTYSIKCVIDYLSYCKTNLHWVESTSMGAHQLQGGGLCLKALPLSICLLAWLCCLSSSTILQLYNFFSFNFVLILFFFIVLTSLGTWHFIIVQLYVYMADNDMTPLDAEVYLLIGFFFLGLMSYFLGSVAFGWTRLTVWMFDKSHQ